MIFCCNFKTFNFFKLKGRGQWDSMTNCSPHTHYLTGKRFHSSFITLQIQILSQTESKMQKWTPFISKTLLPAVKPMCLVPTQDLALRTSILNPANWSTQPTKFQALESSWQTAVEAQWYLLSFSFPIYRAQEQVGNKTIKMMLVVFYVAYKSTEIEQIATCRSCLVFYLKFQKYRCFQYLSLQQGTMA